jgi:hypothetical protein
VPIGRIPTNLDPSCSIPDGPGRIRRLMHRHGSPEAAMEPIRKRKPINRPSPTRDRGCIVTARRNNGIIVVFIIGLICLIYGGYLLSYQMTFTLPAYSLFLVIGVTLISVAFYLKGSG